MDFTNVAKCLKELGYERLTELQKKSLLEVARGDRSVVIVAPTGSGKTEAAVFPVMARIVAERRQPIAAIYITPLRALNRDIERRLKLIAKCFGLDVGVRHGDTPSSIRRSITENPPHILITTPETLNYIVINEQLKKYMANLEFIIVDEFRDLIESKRGLLALTTIYLLEKILGKRINIIALSATLYDEDTAKKILGLYSGAEVLVIKDPSLRRFDIEVSIPTCSSELCRKILGDLDDEKLSARLTEIFERAIKEKHILVFTNTRTLAESLGALLRSLSEKLKLGLQVDVHHGSLSRQHRERVEREFRERKLNILVSTSSLELGIDIGHVDYVVQYMSPRQVVRIVQRIGRSRHRLGDVSRGEIVTTSNPLHMLESCIIATRAMNGDLEKEIILSKPLDVLAYALSLYVYLHPEGVSTSEVYEAIREHPLFTELSIEEFREVLEYLVYTRIIRELGGRLYPTRKTRLYIYKTSMIPSTIDVQVVEVGSGRRVGSLDEEYVVINLSPGDIIVLAGRPWRIISYDETERKLYVEPTGISEEVVIPHWEGENIPVEYETAQSVGLLVKYYKEKHALPEFINKVLAGKAHDQGLEALRSLGDTDSIFVDYIGEFNLIIINVYGGSKVNSLIRDLVKYVLKTQYPYIKVTASSTPYTILIQLHGPLVGVGKTPVEVVYEVVKDLWRYSTRETIERVARESSQFLWRIYQVAQRFGAITPETTHVNKRLLEAFSDTVIGREALKEVLVKDYDISSYMDLAEKIKQGRIGVYLRRYEKLQEHHILLLSYIELPALRELPPLDTSTFMEKLLKRRVTILCLRCGYHREGRVEEFMKMSKFTCPKCNYATLTLVKGDVHAELEVVGKLRRGEKLTPEERRIHEELVQRAVLLYNYGDKALLALSTPGVGSRDAARIINSYINGADLLQLLYEYEKRFIKIKKYLKEKEGK